MIKPDAYIDKAQRFFECQIEKLKQDKNYVISNYTAIDWLGAEPNNELAGLERTCDFFRILRTLILELRAYREVERIIIESAKDNEDPAYSKIIDLINTKMREKGVIYRDDFAPK